MNDLNLRVSGRIGEKVKKPAAPLSIPYWNTGGPSEFFSNLLNCNSADNQLKLLKQFVNNLHNECDEETIKFLVLLFWQADAKHPVKGFLKKHITESRVLCHPFTETFTSVIISETKNSATKYEDYIDTVTRLDAAIDKFPPGALAVSTLEDAVTAYLVECLDVCVRTLEMQIDTGGKNTCTEIKPEPLAPTEINQIYDLVHLTLRLLLYMIQKVTDENRSKLSSKFVKIRSIIFALMLGKEVPMDTKSVSGIIFVTMHLFEKGSGSWTTVLEEDRSHENGTVNLAVYSAVATVVPPADLVAINVNGQPAILDLTDKILAIGDRYSSEPSHTLAVARTLLSASRGLGSCGRGSEGCGRGPEGCGRGPEGCGRGPEGCGRGPEGCGRGPEGCGRGPEGCGRGPEGCGRGPEGCGRGPEGCGRGLAGRLARWCWAHADHHMDSVRHLAAQLTARVVAAAARLQDQGDHSTLDYLYTSLSTLDSSRKSFFVTLTALAEVTGAEVLARRPGVIRDVIHALGTQAVQACATTFLETLLRKHMKQSDPETIYEQWICVILETVKRESDPAVLGILEKILTKAVQWDSGLLRYMLPEQRSVSSYEGSDLKCILLVLSVVRKSGVAYKGVTFDDLRHTAYDADDETRILSLSLVAESPRSTQLLTKDELAFVLHFLDYNINAQSPSFRQLVLANMKKILKRLEDSYKVLKRNQAEHLTELASYIHFISNLRAACFESLSALGNASYGRRYIALQLLSWQEHLQLEGFQRIWTETQAEILFNLLEDSYENNKLLALEVLKNCPVDLIQPVRSPEYVSKAILQASSVRPTDCVAASYKLLLLMYLPAEFQPYHNEHNVPLPSCFGLLVAILNELKEQTTRAQDILRAARDAPMYGLVHCLTRLIGYLDASAIAGNKEWSELIADVTATCEVVNSRVSGVVTAASPEGLLPEDINSDSSGGTRLADGRAVTAQMVLLCAWRSVKETSLLLGCIASRLCLEGEAPSWTLSARRVEHVGEHLIMLLSTVKHRGAFEQAYVGFTLLLGRLWKCKSGLHQLPLQWFSSIERGFALPVDGSTDYCATRRGAGLPFMIQALVTTELSAESTAPRGRLLLRCLELCLRGARAAPDAAVVARAHLVLRALARHCDPPAVYTARALAVAIRGFEADTWTERNSSTLLFSALTVRIFGVARSSGHKLSARNTMTGRIFFLRYPELYDFLLEQLDSVSPESTLRPSLFPTLLLLARLYPSALEGTVSNLKLERFLPRLLSLSGARDGATRRLAARAAAPLVAPHRCIAHIQSLLIQLSDPKMKRNLCHGLLCQLTVLLDLKPGLTIDEESRSPLLAAVRGTYWIPRHLAGEAPCFLVVDEWLKLINLILLRFPKLLDEDLPSVSSLLQTTLLQSAPTITSGRETFLTNAIYLLLIISTSPILLIQCLQHADYEVNLAALNCLLILHGFKEDSCPFLKHLSSISNNATLNELETDRNYVKVLCEVTKNGYLECKQKALKLLALTKNTQREIVKLKHGHVDLTDETVIFQLIDSIRNGHAILSSIYLHSLLSFVSKPVLEVVRVLYECSSADNGEGAREIVVGYLEEHLGMLMEGGPSANKAELFEWSATLAATVAILLEDDAAAVRLRAATAVLTATATQDTDELKRSISAHASRQWRRAVANTRDAPALLLVLAGLDFCADVYTGDELGEECRVFDQNETHNVYLEEFTWTRDCALELKRVYRRTNTNLTIEEYLQALLTNPDYKDTINKLCIDNVTEYLTGRMKTNNPKINLFLKILYE